MATELQEQAERYLLRLEEAAEATDEEAGNRKLQEILNDLTMDSGRLEGMDVSGVVSLRDAAMTVSDNGVPLREAAFQYATGQTARNPAAAGTDLLARMGIDREDLETAA
jgi:hypothetical protein